MFDLLSLPFIEILVHFIMGFVSKTLKGHKFGAVLDISILFVRPPSNEMIILKHKRLRTFAFLSVMNATSCKN